jgi:hypothetical protein
MNSQSFQALMPCQECTRGSTCVARLVESEIVHLGMSVARCLGCNWTDPLTRCTDVHVGQDATRGECGKAVAFVLHRDGTLEHWTRGAPPVDLLLDGRPVPLQRDAFAIGIPMHDAADHVVRAVLGEREAALVILQIKIDVDAMLAFVANFSHNIRTATKTDLRSPCEEDPDALTMDVWYANMDQYMLMPLPEAVDFYKNDDPKSMVRNGLCLFTCCNFLCPSKPYFANCCTRRIRAMQLPFACPSCGDLAVEPEHSIRKIGATRIERLRGRKQYCIADGLIRVQ